MEERRIPEDELIEVRKQKLEKMKEMGRDPFRVERCPRFACITDSQNRKLADISFESNALKAEFEKLEQDGSDNVITAGYAGRITGMRLMGKAAFCTVSDRSGMLQVYLRKDDIEDYEMVKLLDMGDFIGVEGFLFRTKTGEVSLHARSLTVLAKGLRPIPFGKEKDGQTWNTMSDVELRYRQRYVDLVINRESRNIFMLRSKIVSAMREFYESRGYLEVETPVLQSVAGGAAARPFLTHHNALDMGLHLRISLELYLKRLIVGGLEKVFEIGRVFRNEGIDTRHNPEFTLMESYEAYADLDDVMQLVEDMLRFIAVRVHGKAACMYDDEEIDFSKPFRRLPMLQGIEEYAGVKPEAFKNLDSALEAMKSLGLSTEGETMVGGIIEKIHERFVQPRLVQPTFITDFPTENSPLAKMRADDPSLTRRFELYIAKQECGNAFSEINDPIDQKERFILQAQQRAAGDEEAHPMDEDYIRALEYGMPPCGGFGMGIDRLVMILLNQKSIRDVLLFPQMKPEAGEKGPELPFAEPEPAEIDFSKVRTEPLFEDLVDFETFSRSDFRAVKVLECEAVKKSKKLLKFLLDDGSGTPRTILSGIHPFYEPEELVGKTLIAITNLPPRAMMGIDSCGMIISAVHEEEGEEKLHVLMVDPRIPAGAKLY